MAGRDNYDNVTYLSGRCTNTPVNKWRLSIKLKFNYFAYVPEADDFAHGLQ